jgi:hypothetical protein
MINTCVLTGYQFSQCEGQLLSTEGDNYSYKTLLTGIVNIKKETYELLKSQGRFRNPILAGMCRSYNELKQTPPLIDTSLVDNSSTLNPPSTPKEKLFHFLKLIYDMGGKDLVAFDFVSTKDYPLVYGKDAGEFNDILKLADSKSLIEIGNRLPMAQNTVQYRNVRLTDYGIQEVEQVRPSIPMRDLLSNEFFTGDLKIDGQISHAKKLFLQEPRTTENLRSACEQLSFIAEPIRSELEKSKGNDVDFDTFFNIVNNFEVRHNKVSNKPIHFSEQYEFIFYGLLNALIFYYKSKNRI